MNDRLVIRIVALGLLIIVLAIIAAITVVLVSVTGVTSDQKSMLFTGLVGIGTTALGGAAALLASTRSDPPAPPATRPENTRGGSPLTEGIS